MALKQWLIKKLGGKTTTLTDEDREKADIIKGEKRALREAERKVDFLGKIRDLEEKALGDTGKKGTPEDILLKMIMAKMAVGTPQKATPEDSTFFVGSNEQRGFTDEQLGVIVETYKDKLPNDAKQGILKLTGAI